MKNQKHEKQRAPALTDEQKAELAKGAAQAYPPAQTDFTRERDAYLDKVLGDRDNEAQRDASEALKAS